MRREVSAELQVEITAPTELEFQIAVAPRPNTQVSVYAPGLYPMDFHAVAEAFVEGHWRVVDGTPLAPRESLVRIATGRDAANTAFLSNHKGAIALDRLVVTAIVDGDLLIDSIDQLVSIG